MGFQQGLSGVGAAAKQLDVIGNNVANSSTVGFKQSRTEFGDMFAASYYGVAATQNGIGSTVQAVAQQMNQGNVTITNNQLDLAAVTHVDSAGLAFLVKWGKARQAAGELMCLTGVSDSFAKLCSLYAVEPLFDLQSQP